MCLLSILAEESDVIQSELNQDVITSLIQDGQRFNSRGLWLTEGTKKSQMVHKNTLLITLLPKALDIMPAACYLMFKGKFAVQVLAFVQSRRAGCWFNTGP